MQKQVELRPLEVVECGHKQKRDDKNLKGLGPMISRDKRRCHLKLWEKNVTTFLKLHN